MGLRDLGTEEQRRPRGEGRAKPARVHGTGQGQRGPSAPPLCRLGHEPRVPRQPIYQKTPVLLEVSQVAFSSCKQDRLRDGHTKMQRSMSGSEVRAAGAVGSEMDPGCKGQGLEGGWEWSRIHRGAQKLLEWNWCEQRVSHRQPGEGLNEAEVRRSPAIHVTPSSNLKPTRLKLYI